MVTVALLAKNEADRWLPGCLRVWEQFATRICCVDDWSDDGTGELVEEADCETHVIRLDVGLYGNKSEGRRRLFQWAQDHTPLGEWIMVLDADMIPSDDPRPYLENATEDRAAFKVFDRWTMTDFRADELWDAHTRWRTWAVRNRTEPAEWHGEDVHSPHFPDNYGTGLATPIPVGLLHYAYATPDSRIRQYDKYVGLDRVLTEAERAHALTITDDYPTTFPIGETQWSL